MKKTKRNYLIILLAIIVLVGLSITYLCNGFCQNRVLFLAIKSNDFVMATKAIDKGAFINLRKEPIIYKNLDLTNPTPLISACKIGNEEIVKLLLKNGAQINKADNFTGQTPLLAALHGSKENRFSLALYLIENGADFNVCQKTTSPFVKSLYVSETDNNNTIQEGFELFKLLLTNNVSMEIPVGTMNALTYAARYRNINAVEYLIDNGYFDINSRDENGDTALLMAAKYNCIEIVNLLLKKGADCNIQNNNGESAIEYIKYD